MYAYDFAAERKAADRYTMYSLLTCAVCASLFGGKRLANGRLLMRNVHFLGRSRRAGLLGGASEASMRRERWLKVFYCSWRNSVSFRRDGWKNFHKINSLANANALYTSIKGYRT